MSEFLPTCCSKCADNRRRAHSIRWVSHRRLIVCQFWQLKDYRYHSHGALEIGRYASGRIAGLRNNANATWSFLGVVDPTLKIYGIKNVRIVDAGKRPSTCSVMLYFTANGDST